MTIQKIAVIGAGQMGNGIAHVCALAGHDILLHDVSSDRINSGLATITGNMTRQISRVASLKNNARRRSIALARR